MNTSCKNCGKQLKLSEKIVNGIKGLGPGKSLRLKCPQCASAVVLDASILESGASRTKKVSTQDTGGLQGRVQPPSPPDIEWIKEGVFDEEQVIEDVPLALLLMRDSPGRESIIKSIESIGYRIEHVQTAEEAIEKMQFVNYASVILHSSFEGEGLASSTFHKFMCDMSMSKRRFIYYVLVGSEFKTLYNLQALAYSANLVLNESEIPFFNVIIRKAIPEYEELFGPIMEEQRLHGKA